METERPAPAFLPPYVFAIRPGSAEHSLHREFRMQKQTFGERWSEQDLDALRPPAGRPADAPGGWGGRLPEGLPLMLDAMRRPDWGIFDLTALPAFLREARSLTTLTVLTGAGGNRDPERENEAHARRLAASADPAEAFRGAYELAKYHGDFPAARKTLGHCLAGTRAGQNFASAVRAFSGRKTLFIPVIGSETVADHFVKGMRVNALPGEFALLLAALSGGEVFDGIVKRPTSENTNAAAAERAENVAEFRVDGARGLSGLDGRDVAVVDDVYTSGRTALALAGYVLRNCPSARLVSVCVLAASRRGRGIIPSEEARRRALSLARTTEAGFKARTGYGIETVPAAKLAAFKGCDFVKHFPPRRALAAYRAEPGYETAAESPRETGEHPPEP